MGTSGKSDHPVEGQQSAPVAFDAATAASRVDSRSAIASGEVRRSGLLRGQSSVKGGLEAGRARDVAARAVGPLGNLFATEPELILASLESPGGELPSQAATIWAAARQAVRARPHYADLHYFAAQAAWRIGEPEQAAGLLRRALEINPAYTAASILAARVALVLQDPGGAITQLQRALAAGADYADVHLTLGDVHRERGEFELARRAYERALQLNPNLVPAQRGLAMASSGTGGATVVPGPLTASSGLRTRPAAPTVADPVASGLRARRAISPGAQRLIPGGTQETPAQ